MLFFIVIVLWMLFLLMLAIGISGLKSKPVSLAARVRQSQMAGNEGLALRDSEEMDKSLVTRVFLPMANKWSKNFAGITPATLVARADEMIAQAGLIGKVTGVQLTTLSWLMMAGLPAFMFIVFMPHVARGTISIFMLMGVCLISAFLGYRLPVGIVQGRAKKRAHEIQLALPFTFDLISISVEAGMAFDGAMSVVAERTKGALADEMRRTLREINLGITREEALKNLAKRSGVEDLRTFVTAVSYITRMGGSLVDVIKVQTEAMRVKRRQRAEHAANQAPVKIMIPLVLFILPCLFIVILGPAALLLMTKGGI